MKRRSHKVIRWLRHIFVGSVAAAIPSVEITEHLDMDERRHTKKIEPSNIHIPEENFVLLHQIPSAALMSAGTPNVYVRASSTINFESLVTVKSGKKNI